MQRERQASNDVSTTHLLFLLFLLLGLLLGGSVALLLRAALLGDLLLLGLLLGGRLDGLGLAVLLGLDLLGHVGAFLWGCGRAKARIKRSKIEK
jgi:hypothetical protein